MSVTTSVTLGHALKTKLEMYKRRTGAKSLSSIVKLAVEEYLEKHADVLPPVFDHSTCYTIALDCSLGFYACPIGNYEGGPHSGCYATIEALRKGLENQTDKMLWPRENCEDCDRGLCAMHGAGF